MESRTMQKTFRQLIVWREAHSLTLLIYQSTRLFPSDEKYGITSQLRRAASSIGAQIAEGAQMPTMPHRLLYYQRAYASAAEVDNFLELSKDLKYLQEEDYRSLLEHVNKVSFLLSKLIQSQKPTQPTSPTKPTLPTPTSHSHATAAVH